MSVRTRLEASGLFQLRLGTNYVLSLGTGASIYVTRGEGFFEIRRGALEYGRFPNNQRLYEFVRSNAYKTTHCSTDPTFRLQGRYINSVIEMIRMSEGNRA